MDPRAPDVGGDAREPLQEALGGAYRLERELGRGGMATVYLAHDRKHGRSVALKVLHADLGAALGPDRFRREIATAARLQHPHVLSVFDSGEAAGRLWFTMPYVEGESLRDRLTRERQLPLEEAVRITREAAQGLHYAHQHGVVHRDVKPENVLLSQDGSTLVADFGIARALGGSAGEGDGAAARLTGSGLAVGTPAYMSPEQAAGERDVDARSDVYALGAVLYEMLAGEPPFTGPTPQAVLAKRLATPAPSIRVVRPAVPPALGAALARALAAVPADRFATAAGFAAALGEARSGDGSATRSWDDAESRGWARRGGTARRAALGAALLALVALLGAGAWWWRGRAPVPAAGPPTLAVLPFENLGDSADAYFADGVADAVRGKLAGVRAVRVIARASSMSYRATTKPPQQIARELGVDYLLTATVRWDRRGGGRVHVTPELVRVAADGPPTTQWQEQYDAPIPDIFTLQTQVATRVAAAMNLALDSSARAPLTESPTRSLAAYDAFLRGEAVLGGAPDPVRAREAAAHYERAVALDSTFALAWAKLARAQLGRYFTGDTRPVIGRRFGEAAHRAVGLAPSLAVGHVVLGDYYRVVVRDRARAGREYELAAVVEPGTVEGANALARMAEARGAWSEMVRHSSRAAALDPRSPLPLARLATAHLYLRQPLAALAVTDRWMALEPPEAQAYQARARALLSLGDLAGARGAARDAAFRVTPSAEALTHFAVTDDLYWLLDDTQQRVALGLPLAAYGDVRAHWAAVLAQLHVHRGDSALARAYADTARAAALDDLREAPQTAYLYAVAGLMEAYLGRGAEAAAHARRAVELASPSEDPNNGPYHVMQLARVYTVLGDHDRAVAQLEELLRVPYHVTPAWLGVDPNFAPLRDHAGFRRLIQGGVRAE